MHKNDEGRVFIDRNGNLFEYILDYLRNGEWDVPKNDTDFLVRLEREIAYFGLPSVHPPIQEWAFEKHPMYGIGNFVAVKDNGCTVTAHQAVSKSIVLGNQQLNDNQVHYWEITIKSLAAPNSPIIIGNNNNNIIYTYKKKGLLMSLKVSI